MLRAFYSYSHKDADSCALLAAHLKGLSKLLIESWYDRALRPSDQWNRLISDNLDQADLVIVLMSANYMASEFCQLELDRALERRQEGKTKILIAMLTDYNLSGSDLGSIQNFTLYTWPDKDAAFAALSREVEELARKLEGAPPRNKLLHRNRGELAKLLHHVCDRTPQRVALIEALRPQALKPRRPIVLVMHGIRQDAHDWFLDRLEHRLIPEFTGSKPGRLTPLEWPEFNAKQKPIEIFGPRLAGSLPVNPLADTPDWNAALKQCSPASLLPCTVAAGEWGKHGNKLFDAFLQVWEEWPDLPDDRMLIPVVAIKYEADEEINFKISAYLERTRLETRPRFTGKLLPKFEKIRQTHMENWINHPLVSTLFESPENAIARLGVIFDREAAIPIQPLGEVHFPRFLEAL